MRSPLAAMLVALLVLLPLPAPAAPYRPLQGTEGLVAATGARAREVGMQVLRDGGNAVDAAVAVGYALAVVHPVAGNIGGGGFAVVRTALREVVTLDFREQAPGKATRDMYLDARGNVRPRASLDGHLAAGVPGTVAGLSALRDRYGTMPLATLVAPAIRLAERGFVVGKRMSETLRDNAGRLALDPAARKYFLHPDGSAYKAGEVLVQADLAQTLRLIAQQGPDAFYRGSIAGLIAADMAAKGGIITRADLEAYQPVWRAPVWGQYRGYSVASMAPPSSGGVHLVQMLNVLEGYDLKGMGPNSAAAINVMAETMRQAYADRSEFLGDPGFADVPVHWLTSRSYAADIRARIKRGRATPSKEVRPGQRMPIESDTTTHYSVVDHWGNAVSITYTVNDYYGSASAVSGAGFLLNNEMDDFSIKPGEPNLFGLVGGAANAIAPGKRPLSSMTPTVVLKNGEPYLVVGSPGGARIITTVLQVILNVIDHGMTVQQAVNTPRVHMQWLPDELRYEPKGLAPQVAAELAAMGYTLAEKPPMGDVNAILLDGTRAYGSTDPRSEF